MARKVSRRCAERLATQLRHLPRHPAIAVGQERRVQACSRMARPAVDGHVDPHEVLVAGSPNVHSVSECGRRLHAPQVGDSSAWGLTSDVERVDAISLQ
jgi:hypothetical protein